MASRTLSTFTGLDGSDTATVSTGIKVTGVKTLAAFVKEASGNMADAIIEVQCSPNNTDWYSTAVQTAVLADGAQAVIRVPNFAADYFRVKVKTASGGASTFNVIIQGD